MTVVRVSVPELSYLPLHIVCRVNGQVISSKHLQAVALTLAVLLVLPLQVIRIL